MTDGRHPSAEQLALFASGRMPLKKRQAVEAHLDRCATCRGAVDPGRTRDAAGPRPATAPASADPQPGDLLGEYRVLEPLGGGGMGVLYRGEQPEIGKQVAIKIVRRSIAHDAESTQRIIDEARAVNAIRHPNIVDIFSSGRLPDGRPYLVMELLEGLSLQQLLEERGKLSARETLVVLSQALDALDAAHRVGVIHRDIKPANIFVNPRRDGWRVTLLDFGLAKRTSNPDSITNAGEILGTPAYMSPEQIRAETVTAAIDVYALGVVAWQLLGGRNPFKGGGMAETLKAHLVTPPPPLSTEVPGLPPGLEELVLEMLAKDPGERPTTRQARARVDALLAQETGALTASAAASSARGPMLFVSGVVLTVALAGLAFMLYQPEPVTPIPAPAPLPRPVAPAPPPAPEPAVAEQPAPAPPPATPAVPGFPHTRACGKILDVTPIYDSNYLGTWQAFQITFSDDVPLTVAVKAPSMNKAGLKKMRAAIVGCRSGAKSIGAARVKAFTGFGWPMDNGIWFTGGSWAYLEDIKVF